MTPYLVRLKTKLDNARKQNILARYWDVYQYAYDEYCDQQEKYQNLQKRWEERLKRHGLL